MVSTIEADRQAPAASPPPPDSPPALREEWSGWNIAGDQVAAGSRRYQRADDGELVQWYFHFAQAQGWSMAEAASRAGVDTSTLSRVLRGEYRNDKRQVLPPPAKMLSRLRMMRDDEAESRTVRNRTRIDTPTRRLIWQVCEKVRRQRSMGMVFGDSHIGKTYAVRWYEQDHNHGITVYIRCSAVSGVQALYKLFADALRISSNTPTYKLRPRVLETLDENNFVIVDEFHQITHTYRRGSSIAMIEALREIHDRCGCGMLLVGTDVARDEIRDGHDAKLLRQIDRRGIVKLNLPAGLPVGDVRAVVEAYGLDFPLARKGERWRQLARPDEAHLQICREIALFHGIKRLVLTLQDASHLASKERRELAWDDFVRAHSIYLNLERPQEI